MGKKSKKKWWPKRAKGSGSQGSSSNNNKKRRKLGRYWIEDCPSLEPAVDGETDESVCEALVWITRVELTDDHHRKNSDSERTLPTSNTAKEDEAVASEDEQQARGDDDDSSKEEASPRSDNDKAALPDTASTAQSSSSLSFDNTDSLELARAMTKITIQPWDKASRKPPKLFVKRSVTAGPAKMHYPQHYHKHYMILPNGDCGDGIVNPHKAVPDKYWAQRHRLFRRFDEGIQLDEEGWFSVTPQAIANHIASKTSILLKERAIKSKKRIILDAFGGMGGNTIAFALRSDVDKVVCVDTDLARLKMAASNSKIYDVPAEKILFVHADACQVLRHYGKASDDDSTSGEVQSKKSESESDQTLSGYSVLRDFALLPDHLDAIFLSPPWGGVDYQEKAGRRHYDLTCIELNDGAANGQDLFRLAYQACPTVLYFLPRNINGLSLGQEAVECGFSGVIELEQQVLNGKMKTVTAYFRTTSSGGESGELVDRSKILDKTAGEST